MQDGPGPQWAEVCCALTLLCPALEQLEVGGFCTPLRPVHLQRLPCLCSLDIGLEEEDAQGALPGLAKLTALTDLALRKAAEFGDPVNLSTLSTLQGLQRLGIHMQGTLVQGIPSIALQCTQLARLELEAEGVDACEEDTQGGSGDSTASRGPMWRSLRELALLLSDPEPGYLTLLCLDEATNLERFSPQAFSLSLLRDSPTSDPRALRDFCKQLAGLPAGLCPASMELCYHG